LIGGVDAVERKLKCTIYCQGSIICIDDAACRCHMHGCDTVEQAPSRVHETDKTILMKARLRLRASICYDCSMRVLDNLTLLIRPTLVFERNCSRTKFAMLSEAELCDSDNLLARARKFLRAVPAWHNLFPTSTWFGKFGRAELWKPRNIRESYMVLWETHASL